MNLQYVLNHPVGRIIISVLLGLGLASLFRKVCSGSSCMIMQSPNIAELEKYYYKMDDDCYKYTPVATKCK